MLFHKVTFFQFFCQFLCVLGVEFGEGGGLSGLNYALPSFFFKSDRVDR